MPQVAGAPVELLVARRGGGFAGAAALFWQSWTILAGFPTLIHVVADERRKRFGRRLLAFAADLAAEEADGLRSYTPAPDGEAARLMAACGCLPARRKHQALVVVLWRIETGVGLVEARVVHPKFRGGWSNLVLMEAGLMRALDEAVVRFRFQCDDTVRDTIRLARRCGALETLWAR
jgi:GNAT superfamily N-acetyltransferase